MKCPVDRRDRALLSVNGGLSSTPRGASSAAGCSPRTSRNFLHPRRRAVLARNGIIAKICCRCRIFHPGDLVARCAGAALRARRNPPDARAADR